MTIWNNLQWILGFTGIAGIGWVALAFFAPSVMSVVAEYLKALSPLFRGLADGIVEFIKVLYAGLKDVVDSFSTVVFVCVIAGLSFLYGTQYKSSNGKNAIAELRKDYKFVKRTPRGKAAYLRSLKKTGWKKKVWGGN